MRSTKTSVVCAGFGVFLVVVAVQGAGPSYSEPFNTDVADTAGFLATYGPPWSIPQTDGNVVNVVNGQMRIKEIVNLNSYTRVVRPGFDAVTYPTIVVEVDTAAQVNNAWYDQGLDLGEVFISFSPGYAADGGRGWFKINNLWGSGDVGGTDMGFVPANDVMHHMKVVWTQALGQFDITITDGANPANVFHYLWSHASAAGANGRPVGIYRSGPDDHFAEWDGLAIYDNFSVTPEPGALLLMCGGFLGMMRRRPRRA